MRIYESKFQQKPHLQLHILVCKRWDLTNNVTISDTNTASLKKKYRCFLTLVCGKPVPETSLPQTNVDRNWFLQAHKCNCVKSFHFVFFDYFENEKSLTILYIEEHC